MNIRTALNRIGLYALLDKNLTWDQIENDDPAFYADYGSLIDKLNHIIYLEIKGSKVEIKIEITKDNIADRLDNYHGEVETRRVGERCISAVSTFNIVLPHNEKLLCKAIPENEKAYFISLYEGTRDGAYMILDESFNEGIIEYANVLNKNQQEIQKREVL